MRSPLRTGAVDRNPYVAGRADRTRLRDLMIRMFLVIVPAQLVGFVLGTLIAAATGAFGLPYGGLIVNVAAAAIAGLAVGLVITPATRSRPLAAVVVVALGAAVATAVIMVATARLAAGYAPGPLDYAPGVIVTAVGQGLIAGLCWLIKSRRKG